jgi:hypothetical protein
LFVTFLLARLTVNVVKKRLDLVESDKSRMILLLSKRSFGLLFNPKIS